MTSGPPSHSAEVPPQPSTGADGGIPPGGTPQASESECTTDTVKSVSWRQHQQHIDENQQATPNQATHADDQSDGVRLERIHESPTPLPNPRGEDGTPEQGETSVLATYSDHIHIPENPLSVVARRLIESTTLVAFLAAVSLPFLYLPLLLFGGFDSTRFTAVLLLLGLHAISLAIGYQYEPTKPFGSD